MIRRAGKYLLWATGLAALATLGVMALMRRDHKVEIVVTYPRSSPAALAHLRYAPRTAARFTPTTP